MTEVKKDGRLGFEKSKEKFLPSVEAMTAAARDEGFSVCGMFMRQVEPGQSHKMEMIPFAAGISQHYQDDVQNLGHLFLSIARSLLEGDITSATFERKDMRSGAVKKGWAERAKP